MVTRVDLSAPTLRPSAVLDLVKHHTAHRPQENILFRVSPETFALYRQGWPDDYVRASQEETDEMNSFLGLDWTPEDYGMGRHVHCKNCDRLITFYDMLQSGRKLHGDEHMKRVLATGAFHLQVAKEGQVLEVVCVRCGILNVSGDYTHYHSGSYCYA